MSSIEHRNTIQALTRTLQGLGLGVVLALLSLLSVQVQSVTLSLMFLPVAIIVLWPKGASISWSYFMVFLIGLVIDILAYSPLGIWSLTLLIGYLALGDYAAEQTSLRGRWSLFLVAELFCALCYVLAGRLFLGLWVPLFPLALGMAVAAVLFPVVHWGVSLGSGLNTEETGSRARS